MMTNKQIVEYWEHTTAGLDERLKATRLMNVYSGMPFISTPFKLNQEVYMKAKTDLEIEAILLGDNNE